MKECIICGATIHGKRADAKYCSTKCANDAKAAAAAEKFLINNRPQQASLYGFQPEHPQRIDKPADELRTTEKHHFQTIMDMERNHTEKVNDLNLKLLNADFEKKGLEKEILDLKAKHSEELAASKTSTTKDTVNLIAQMPAVQGFLGGLSNKMMSKGGSALAGIEEFNENEKQIINGIRALSPEVQPYFVQMAYTFFSKPTEEQTNLVQLVTSFLTGEQDSDDI